MDLQKLEMANRVHQQINQCTDALNCFDFKPYEDRAPVSLNPKIIIEYDGDGREQMLLPFPLSESLIAMLKSEITKQRELAMAEFREL